MAKRGKMKSVYVVKSAPKEIDEKHKELNKKNVYLLKSDEQVVNLYRDIVCDFVDENDGLFIAISQDKTFFHNFRNSFYKELEIDQERIRISPTPRRAREEISVYREYLKKPFLFIESQLEGYSSLPVVEEMKAEFKDMFIIVMMHEVDEKKMAQFVEAGADNFITKPVSVNILIEKIANTLVPPDEIGKKVREGKERLRKVEFALAYGVARDILEMKPGSPAGLMIMGDALKGLGKRMDALKLYLQAAENAHMYLEPLKKIVVYYEEEDDQESVLKYLLKIDELSPLHKGRKQQIAELYFTKGEIAKAASYFLAAIRLMHEQKLSDCVNVAVKYANRIYEKNMSASLPLLEACSKLARVYSVELDWSLYNRLGMLLRRDKRWREAIDAYVKAAHLSPKDESILFNMGMAFVEGKDYGSAAEKFERALKLNPDLYKGNLEIAYGMGQIFMKANRLRNAARVLEDVYSVDPNYKKVGELLKSLKEKKK
ncbi:tetratricopeptide repeat protein [Pseudodesulfovibrio sp. zrk46]|uniref:tetratricopeptide repeat protein n=1 Tax=Pseudodesulfovibrio sp. zrk46 TaxID=2725288 RepID=UPI00144A17BA|nr:tetratricopeptide repeat protein [Pseudodesulfovibrio sp. zrk46]QJB56864.1 tetratricopeptide repeat protein [Pseudodesulfovibrio sp. zrk46]